MDGESVLLRRASLELIQERHREQTSAEARTKDLLKNYTFENDTKLPLLGDFTSSFPGTYGESAYSAQVSLPYDTFDKDGVSYEARVVKCSQIKLEQPTEIHLITVNIAGQTGLGRESVVSGFVLDDENISEANKSGVFLVPDYTSSGTFSLTYSPEVESDQAESIYEEFARAVGINSNLTRLLEESGDLPPLEAMQRLDRLDLSLTEIGLSNGVMGVLREHDIKFISDVVRLNGGDLHRLGFSNSTIREVSRCLKTNSYRLLPKKEARLDVEEIFDKEHYLDPRIVNSLKQFSIYSIEDLLQKRHEEIRYLPNIGIKCMVRIRTVLADRGLLLRSFRE